MTGETTGPELSLISESVGNASARIRFFRLAFGAASTQEITRREILSVLDDMTRGSRLTVEWHLQGGAQRSDVRMVFLAQQCLETAMPYGGEITISKDVNGWSIRGSSEKFKVDESLWAMLADGKIHTDITPAQVHFALLAVHCREEGRKLRSTIGQEEILIRF